MSGIKHTVPFGPGSYTVEVEQSCYYCRNYNIDREYCTAWQEGRGAGGTFSRYANTSDYNDCSRWVHHAVRAGTD